MLAAALFTALALAGCGINPNDHPNESQQPVLIPRTAKGTKGAKGRLDNEDEINFLNMASDKELVPTLSLCGEEDYDPEGYSYTFLNMTSDTLTSQKELVPTLSLCGEEDFDPEGYSYTNSKTFRTFRQFKPDFSQFEHILIPGLASNNILTNVQDNNQVLGQIMENCIFYQYKDLSVGYFECKNKVVMSTRNGIGLERGVLYWDHRALRFANIPSEALENIFLEFHLPNHQHFTFNGCVCHDSTLYFVNPNGDEVFLKFENSSWKSPKNTSWLEIKENSSRKAPIDVESIYAGMGDKVGKLILEDTKREKLYTINTQGSAVKSVPWPR